METYENMRCHRGDAEHTGAIPTLLSIASLNSICVSQRLTKLLMGLTDGDDCGARDAVTFHSKTERTSSSASAAILASNRRVEPSTSSSLSPSSIDIIAVLFSTFVRFIYFLFLSLPFLFSAFGSQLRQIVAAAFRRFIAAITLSVVAFSFPFSAGAPRSMLSSIIVIITSVVTFANGDDIPFSLSCPFSSPIDGTASFQGAAYGYFRRSVEVQSCAAQGSLWFLLRDVVHAECTRADSGMITMAVSDTQISDGAIFFTNNFLQGYTSGMSSVFSSSTIMAAPFTPSEEDLMRFVWCPWRIVVEGNTFDQSRFMGSNDMLVYFDTIIFPAGSSITITNNYVTKRSSERATFFFSGLLGLSVCHFTGSTLPWYIRIDTNLISAANRTFIATQLSSRARTVLKVEKNTVDTIVQYAVAPFSGFVYTLQTVHDNVDFSILGNSVTEVFSHQYAPQDANITYIFNGLAVFSEGIMNRSVLLIEGNTFNYTLDSPNATAKMPNQLITLIRVNKHILNNRTAVKLNNNIGILTGRNRVLDTRVTAISYVGNNATYQSSFSVVGNNINISISGFKYLESTEGVYVLESSFSKTHWTDFTALMDDSIPAEDADEAWVTQRRLPTNGGVLLLGNKIHIRVQEVQPNANSLGGFVFVHGIFFGASLHDASLGMLVADNIVKIDFAAVLSTAQVTVGFDTVFRRSAFGAGASSLYTIYAVNNTGAYRAASCQYSTAVGYSVSVRSAIASAMAHMVPSNIIMRGMKLTIENVPRNTIFPSRDYLPLVQTVGIVQSALIGLALYHPNGDDPFTGKGRFIMENSSMHVRLKAKYMKESVLAVFKDVSNPENAPDVFSVIGEGGDLTIRGISADVVVDDSLFGGGATASEMTPYGADVLPLAGLFGFQLERMRVFVGGSLTIGPFNTIFMLSERVLVMSVAAVTAGGVGNTDSDRVVPLPLLGQYLSGSTLKTDTSAISLLRIINNSFQYNERHNDGADTLVVALSQKWMRADGVRRNSMSLFGVVINDETTGGGGPSELLIEGNTLVSDAYNCTQPLYSSDQSTYLPFLSHIYFNQTVLSGARNKISILKNNLTSLHILNRNNPSITITMVAVLPLSRLSTATFVGAMFANNASFLVQNNSFSTIVPTVPSPAVANEVLNIALATNSMGSIALIAFLESLTIRNFSTVLIDKNSVVLDAPVRMPNQDAFTRNIADAIFSEAMRGTVWRSSYGYGLDSTRMQASLVAFEEVSVVGGLLSITHLTAFISNSLYFASLVAFTPRYKSPTGNMHMVIDGSSGSGSGGGGAGGAAAAGLVIHGIAVRGRFRAIVLFEPHTRGIVNRAESANGRMRLSLRGRAALTVGCSSASSSSSKEFLWYSAIVPQCRSLSNPISLAAESEGGLASIVSQELLASSVVDGSSGSTPLAVNSAWQQPVVKESTFEKVDAASAILSLRGAVLNMTHIAASSSSPVADLIPQLAVIGWAVGRYATASNILRPYYAASAPAAPSGAPVLMSVFSTMALLVNESTVVVSGRRYIDANGDGAVDADDSAHLGYRALDASIGRRKGQRLPASLSASSPAAPELTAANILLSNVCIALLTEGIGAGIASIAVDNSVSSERHTMVSGLGIGLSNMSLYGGAQLIVKGVTVRCDDCALSALAVAVVSLSAGSTLSAMPSPSLVGGGALAMTTGGAVQIAENSFVTRSGESLITINNNAESSPSLISHHIPLSALGVEADVDGNFDRYLRLSGFIRVCGNSVNTMLPNRVVSPLVFSSVAAAAGAGSGSDGVLLLDNTTCNPLYAASDSLTRTRLITASGTVPSTLTHEPTSTRPLEGPPLTLTQTSLTTSISLAIPRNSPTEERDITVTVAATLTTDVERRSTARTASVSPPLRSPSQPQIHLTASASSANFADDATATVVVDDAEGTSRTKSHQHHGGAIVSASISVNHDGDNNNAIPSIQRTVSVTPPLPPPVTTLPPIAQAREDSERALSAVLLAGGGLAAAGSAGQASVAMTMLRVGQCLTASSDGVGRPGGGIDFSPDDNDVGRPQDTNGDGVDDDDSNSAAEPLSPFIHPLSFALGDGPYRFYMGAILGNCVIIPIVTGVLVRFPVVWALQHWGLQGRPPTEEVLTYIGWPSILVLPYMPLAEGTATSMTALLMSSRSSSASDDMSTDTSDAGSSSSSSSVPTIVGLVGAASLLGLLIAWGRALYIVYRLPIRRARTPFEGYLWWPFLSIVDWGPIDGEEKSDADGDSDGDGGNGAGTKNTDGGCVAAGDSTTSTSGSGKAASPLGALPSSSASSSPSELPPPTPTAVEDVLERNAHILGGKLIIAADGLSLCCSIIVGVIEGLADADDDDDSNNSLLGCRGSVTALAILAVVQSVLECTTTAPAELTVQLLIGICVTLIAVSAVVDSYDVSDNDGFLSDTDGEALGLAVNILGFFGLALGVICSIIRLLRQRSMYAAVRAMRVLGQRLMTRRALRIKQLDFLRRYHLRKKKEEEERTAAKDFDGDAVEMGSFVNAGGGSSLLLLPAAPPDCDADEENTDPMLQMLLMDGGGVMRNNDDDYDGGHHRHSRLGVSDPMDLFLRAIREEVREKQKMEERHQQRGKRGEGELLREGVEMGRCRPHEGAGSAKTKRTSKTPPARKAQHVGAVPLSTTSASAGSASSAPSLHYPSSSPALPPSPHHPLPSDAVVTPSFSSTAAASQHRVSASVRPRQLITPVGSSSSSESVDHHPAHRIVGGGGLSPRHRYTRGMHTKKMVAMRDERDGNHQSRLHPCGEYEEDDDYDSDDDLHLVLE